MYLRNALARNTCARNALAPGGRGHNLLSRRLAACALVLGVILANPVTVSGGELSGSHPPAAADRSPSQEGPSMDVEPDAPLHEGQTLTVTGTGFDPRQGVAGGICTADAVGRQGDVGLVPIEVSECDGSQIKVGETDADGRIRFTFVVSASLQTPSGVYDCAAKSQSCVAGIVALDDPKPLVSDLGFATAPRATRPKLVITDVRAAPPGTNGRDDLGAVDFRLEGEPADRVTGVRECLRVGDGWDSRLCSDSYAAVQVGSDGTATGSIILYGFVTDSGETADCSSPSRPCVLVAGIYGDASVSAVVPAGASATG